MPNLGSRVRPTRTRKTHHEWADVSGSELQDASQRRELDLLLEERPAVYLWRRKLHAGPDVLRSAQAFAKWIEDLLRTPYARIGERRLTHFLRLEGAVLGGSDLSDLKREALEEIAANRESRTVLAEFVESLTLMTPPLYVGESQNLMRRVGEHLAGQSQFSFVLSDQLRIPWEHTRLSYVYLSSVQDLDDNAAEAKRRLYEMIATHLTLAGSVRRPG